MCIIATNELYTLVSLILGDFENQLFCKKKQEKNQVLNGVVEVKLVNGAQRIKNGIHNQ